jgi:large subunit ribosomal protein L20
MTRVKRGINVKKRHKRLLKFAKGNWGQRKNIFRRAKETVMRAWAYAFKSRRLRKRDMRSLFITRINAAAQQHSMRYSTLIHGLKKANIILNRKMLSQIAIFEPSVFEMLVNKARGA